LIPAGADGSGSILFRTRRSAPTVTESGFNQKSDRSTPPSARNAAPLVAEDTGLAT
jgi:hypothetical protein